MQRSSSSSSSSSSFSCSSSSSSSCDLKLPVFDLSKPLSPSSLSSLYDACTEWGFFHVSNHGVSGDLFEKIRRLSYRIFRLPYDSKMKIGPSSPININAYTPHFIASPFFESLRVSGPDFFSSAKSSVDVLFDNDPPDSEFSDLMKEYGEKMTELSNKIVKAVLDCLGNDLQRKFYESEFRNCHGYFRLNNYTTPRRISTQQEQDQDQENKREQDHKQEEDRKQAQEQDQDQGQVEDENRKLGRGQDQDYKQEDQEQEREEVQDREKECQERDQERQKHDQVQEQDQDQEEDRELERGLEKDWDDQLIEGLGMHTDMSCVTIVSQDEIGGLQVRSKEGKWMDINPSHGGESLVVNVGDMLHAWSNGRLRSSQHRVVLKRRSFADRFSIAFFWCFDDRKVVFAPDEVVGQGNKRAFESFTCGDYLRFRQSSEKGKFEKVGYTVKDFAGVIRD